MFRCNDCDSKFYDPATYKECVGEFWGTPAYETFSCCPVCKSDDFEEVEDE